MGDHRVDAVERHLVGDAQLVVLRAERLGGAAGVGQFVDAVGEPDGERRGGAGAVGQRRGEARIDAAGQERALFHLRRAVDVHRVGNGGTDLFDIVVERPCRRGERRCPPSGEGQVAVGGDAHVVTGRQFRHPFDGGVGFGHVLEREEPQHRFGSHGGEVIHRLGEGGEFGGEPECAGVVLVVERFDPERVPAAHQVPGVGVPDGHGVHAPQPGEGVGAFLGVEVQHHFEVAVGAQTPAARFEAGPQLEVVVDLAVADEDVAPIVVAEGLAAVAEPHDGEAAEGEGEPFVVPHLVVVRAAVTHDCTGGGGLGGVVNASFEPSHPSNAAH